MRPGLFSLLLLTMAPPLAAGPAPLLLDDAVPEAGQVEWWERATVLDDPDAPFLQRLRFMTRYHTHMASVDSDQGASADWETRRLRFGVNAEFLRQFELRNEWNATGLDDELRDPAVANIDTLFLSWKPSKAFQTTLGKHKAPLTQEFRTSSNELLFTERSVLTQSVMTIERHWGLSAKGNDGPWSWLAGVWAGTFRGDYNQWYDDEGPAFGLASLGYDFGGEGSDWEKALLSLQYAHSGEVGAITPEFEDVLSLNFEGEAGRWSLNSDLLAGWGDRGVVGIQVTPGYFLTENLQAVARLEYADGDANTLSRRLRYERLVSPAGAGDRSTSVYLGLNYYLDGHHAKLMLGAESVDLEDHAGDGGEFAGWTCTAGWVVWF